MLFILEPLCSHQPEDVVPFAFSAKKKKDASTASKKEESELPLMDK